MASSVPLQAGRALAPQPIAATSPLAESPTAPSPTSGPSLVAKEWVVPPRPKPGRKPATDTPPTRRKAQNRAAQRAFRERRAAKVGELEAQMDEMERQYEGTVEDLQSEMAELERKLDQRLKDAVDAYENDLKDMGNELLTWKIRSRDLEGLVLEERRKREAVEKQLEALKSGTGALDLKNGKDGESLEGPSEDMIQAEQAYQTPPELPLGCGRCTFSRCQCIEEVFGSTELTAGDGLTQKRALSPSNLQEEAVKRLKKEAEFEEERPLETDFTTFNTSQPTFGVSTATIDNGLVAPAPAPPIESCGFCQGGGTCLCAELAADQERMTASSLSVPTPDDTAVNLGTKSTTVDASKPASGCSSDPGTCAKCRSDPTSTLLCKTIAASQPEPLRSVSSVAKSTEPCPLGTACCRVSKTLDTLPTNSSSNIFATSNASRPGQVQAITGPTLSCADAFTTLSRHPAFQRASKDLGEWLPRLVTIPSVANKSGGDGDQAEASTDIASSTPESDNQTQITHEPGTRTAFDIEAASVMGVLRMFDRRFGRD